MSMTADYRPSDTNNTGSKWAARWIAGLFLLSFVSAITPSTRNLAAQQDADKQTSKQDKQDASTSSAAAVPDDQRLGPPKDLNGYFPFKPYKSRAEWDQRAEQLRRQLLVATGLWPMPERTPPRAVVHGKVDRDEYTVEKVIIESWPGHYVTGNLYRPKGKSGKLPAVLCPHGHWNNGRFYDAGEAALKAQIKSGGEKHSPSGRFPLQARCVQLARMGCVVFHYDMLGYADSVQIPHSVAHGFRDRRPHMEGSKDWGFFSPQAELHLQSILGLQTYNSVRALDWLSELPDVDATRIGVTGASGGGTQTFVLCAIDPRPAVAFPAVMVSTAMQGGCTCENCSYLRIGTGNIEIAALIAPRPLGMTAADDWTKEMETKGFPELKEHYKLFGLPENVTLAALLQFDHNYNYPSRAAMYEWMNRHLRLDLPTPIVEANFKPLSREEMSVWTDEHPTPSGDAVGEAYEQKLLRQMTEAAAKQIRVPIDSLVGAPASGTKDWETVVETAWDVLLGRRLPNADAVRFNVSNTVDRGSYALERGQIEYAAMNERLPSVFLLPKDSKNETVIWLDQRGKAALFDSSAEPVAAIKKLLDAGVTVVGVDLLHQGDFLTGNDPETKLRIQHPRNYAGFTYGYNYPLFSKRVHDVLSTIAAVRNRTPKVRIGLFGSDSASAWAMAAVLQAPKTVDALMVGNRFRFREIQTIGDSNLVPGAVKYGDVEALQRLARSRVNQWYSLDDSRETESSPVPSAKRNLAAAQWFVTRMNP
ncbi:MAG: alpha/beta hydrolase family protein [Pirellulales bacterium]